MNGANRYQKISKSKRDEIENGTDKSFKIIYDGGKFVSLSKDIMSESTGGFYDPNVIKKIMAMAEFEDLAPRTEGSGFIIDYDTSYIRNNPISLTITADDVSGRKSTTTIHYTVVYNSINTETGEIDNDHTYTITGSDTSSDFGTNPSYTDTRTVTVAYKFNGLKATATITQGVWVDTVEADYISLNDNTYAEELGWTGSWNTAQGWYVDTDNNPDTSKYALYYTDVSNSEINGTIYSDSDWESTTDLSKAYELDNNLYGKITGVTEFTVYVAFINIPSWSFYYGPILRDKEEGKNINSNWNASDDIDDTFNSSNYDDYGSYKCTWTGLDASKTYYLCDYFEIYDWGNGLSEVLNTYKYSKIELLVPLSLNS